MRAAGRDVADGCEAALARPDDEHRVAAGQPVRRRGDDGGLQESAGRLLAARVRDVVSLGDDVAADAREAGRQRAAAGELVRAMIAWSVRRAARKAQPFVRTTAPPSTCTTALPAPSRMTLLAPADMTMSAVQVPSDGASRSVPKRAELSDTEAALNGPETTMPTASPRKPPSLCGPTVSTTLPVTRMSSAATATIPARTGMLVAPSADAGERVAGDGHRLGAQEDDPERRVGAFARCDVEELVVVDGDALGRALPLDRDARAHAREDVLLDHERSHGGPRAIAVPARSCTRLPVIRTCPGATPIAPCATTIPSVPCRARSATCR